MAKNVTRIILVVGFILVVPLILTLLNPSSHIRGGQGGGWDWQVGDFVVMGGLLLMTGLAIDYVLRRFANSKYKMLIVGAIVLALLVIWAELAVGIFNTPFGGS